MGALQGGPGRVLATAFVMAQGTRQPLKLMLPGKTWISLCLHHLQSVWLNSRWAMTVTVQCHADERCNVLLCDHTFGVVRFIGKQTVYSCVLSKVLVEMSCLQPLTRQCIRPYCLEFIPSVFQPMSLLRQSIIIHATCIHLGFQASMTDEALHP